MIVRVGLKYTHPCVQEGRDICIITVPSLGLEDPLEEGTATHSSILAWKLRGRRSLVGYCPWVHKESDTTEAT